MKLHAPSLEGLIWAGQKIGPTPRETPVLIEMAPERLKTYPEWVAEFDNMPIHRMASAPDIYLAMKEVNLMSKERLRVLQIADVLHHGIWTATDFHYIAQQNMLVCTDERKPILTRTVEITEIDFAEVWATPNLEKQIFKTAKGYEILKTIFDTADSKEELYLNLNYAAGLHYGCLSLPPQIRTGPIAFWNINNGHWFGCLWNNNEPLKAFGVRK